MAVALMYLHLGGIFKISCPKVLSNDISNALYLGDDYFQPPSCP
jgi:hypothetical protein